MGTYQLWFDGGARGNPGPAAAGVVIKDEDQQILIEHGEYLGTATNNQAEYRAFRIGLAELFEYLGETGTSTNNLHLEVRTDSQLLQKQIDEVWKTKDEDLESIQDDIRSLLAQLDDWNIEHVPREENKQADRLVNEALDQEGK